MRDTPKAKLIIYLACTFGLSAVFYGIIISSGFGAYGGLAVFGLMWAVYHYPIILFSGYRSSAPLWYATIMFTLMVLAISVVFAWLRLRSGSLWTGVILHATHNLVIQSVFNVLTEDRGATAWITGEFGVGLVIAYAAAALWCWKRRGGLS